MHQIILLTLAGSLMPQPSLTLGDTILKYLETKLNPFFLILCFYYSHGFLERFLFSGIIIIFMVGRLGRIVYFSSKSRKYADVRVENILSFACKDNNNNSNIINCERFIYEKRLQFRI